MKESLTGRQYAFTYARGQTIVVEGTGHSHVFGQNAAGITVRFDSTNGVWWRLKLDEQNRVVEAHSSGGAHQYAYGREGQITRAYAQLPDEAKSREFQYDSRARITGVASSDGGITAVDYAGGLTVISGPDGELSFDTLPSGRIAEASRNQTTVRADYDSEGQLSGLRKGERSVEIDRGPLGRASAIRHADGTLNKYEYDALGNRAFVSFGFGGAVRYAHDPSGNIVEVAVEHPLGGVRRQAVEIGDMNRVESIDYIGAGRFEIGYDAMGRAVSFRMGGNEVLVEYEGPNRIGRIVSKATGAQWSPGEGAAGSATSAVADARLELLHGDSAGAAHADYGIVAFDETTFGLAAGDPVQRGVPGLREARRLLAVAEPLFSGDGDSAMMAFEKPSNPVFQPLEYRSTNCCISIPILPAALVPGAGPPIGIKAPSFCVPPPPPSTGLPSYDPPELAEIPTPEIDNTLRGEWGHYEIGWLNAHFVCQASMESDVARLEGDVTGFVNEIKYRTTVPARGNCTTGTRTREQINRTIDHERKHAEAWVEFVNSIRKDERLGVTYPDVDKCLVMRDALDKDFRKKYPEIASAQSNHSGGEFCGEEKYTSHCPENAPPGTKATEVGTGNYYGSGNCD